MARYEFGHLETVDSPTQQDELAHAIKCQEEGRVEAPVRAPNPNNEQLSQLLLPIRK